MSADEIKKESFFITRWHARPVRGGIFALIVNDINPFSGYINSAGLSDVGLIAEGSYEEQDAADDFIDRVNEKVKGNRIFKVGLVETRHPYYQEVEVDDEFYYSILLFFKLCKGKFKYHNHKVDVSNYKSAMDAYWNLKGDDKPNHRWMENYILEYLRGSGYDSVVWVKDGLAKEIFYFGDKAIKWYDEL